jgi:hypothetical protein
VKLYSQYKFIITITIPDLYLKDIIDWALDAGSDLPLFVAADLRKLPALGMDAINLAKLVTDIADMRTEMGILKLSLAGRSDSNPGVVAEDSPSTDSDVIATHAPVVQHQSPPNHDPLDDPTTAEARSATDSNGASASSGVSAAANKAPASTASTEPAQGLDTDTTFAKVAASLGGTDSDGEGFQFQNNRRGRRNGRLQPSNPPPSQMPPTRRPARGSVREAAIEGSATNLHSLQAARRHTTGLTSASAGPNAGGLFITQVRSGTHFMAVKNHIFRRTGLRLRVISVRSRNEHHYASFRILCNRTELQRLLEPSLWPKGVFVKEFEDH